MSNVHSEIRRFGKFRLDVTEKDLWFDNEPVAVPEKAIEVLIALTERPGVIVKKEDLASQIWGGSTEAANSLTHAIHALRKALRETDATEFITTVPRRGYRFVGPISITSDNKLLSVPPTEVSALVRDADPPVSTRPILASVRWGRWRIPLLGAIILVLLVGTGAIWLRSRPVAGFSNVSSMAVLPLKPIGDLDRSLGMRITDSVITRLSSVNEVRVRPTAVVQKYLDSDAAIRETGRELRVEVVFEGSVEQREGLLLVELRAFATDTGERLWSDRFIGEPQRLLPLQDTISQSIVKLLRYGKDDDSGLDLGRNPTENAEAYDLYLKGRYFWQKRTPAGLAASIEYFQRAIELDPSFAAAHVGIADSYYLLYDYDYDGSPENVKKAGKHLDLAIAISPDDHGAFVTRGLIQTTYEWDWQGAAESFERALALRPNSPDAYHRRGMLILKLGDRKGAEANLRRAVELEPTSIGINMNLGVVLYFSGMLEDAIRQFRFTIELDKTLASPRWYLARCYWESGDKERAIAAYLEALDASKGGELAESIRQRRKVEPIDDVIRFWINEWEQAGISEYGRAVLWSHLGDKASTMRLLQKAIESRHPWATNIYVEPEFAMLDGEPEFAELLGRLNIPARAK